MTFKEVVQKIREVAAPRHGMLKFLARELHVSQSYLSQMLYGVKPLSRELLGKFGIERLAPDVYKWN
jgi:DNA-binding transcriptional regulator YdaS (Cro superfamily)